MVLCHYKVNQVFLIFASMAKEIAPVEKHPLEPFLPEKARILMLGSFPPSRKRWSMDFFYPNWINDMWKIWGLIFHDDKDYFVAEEDGKIVAGLDACITAFKILYVSTVFVDEDCRRKGYGKLLIKEMEKRAKELGVNTIRLDTFSWQGKEFYESLNYEIVGSYENDNDGYAEYFFLKRI